MSTDPVVHIAVEQSKGRNFQWDPRDVADNWNWAEKGKEPLPVYVYSNGDEVELFLGNRSLGRRSVGRDDYYARWDVSFKAGKIRAVGNQHDPEGVKYTSVKAGKMSDGRMVIYLEPVTGKSGKLTLTGDGLVPVEVSL